MTARVDRKAGGDEIRLVLGSRLEYLDAVHRLTEEVGRSCGLSRSQTFELGLAVREAFVNALTHGNQLNSSKKVRVRFRVNEDALRVCVEDEGPGFDLQAAPDPCAPENLDRSAGRGVFLMRHYVDEVTVSRDAGRGARICLVKRLNPARREPRRRAAAAGRFAHSSRSSAALRRRA